ncbi:MAG: DUF1353 domain-containing protein [Methylobacterium radiotolerans]
MTDKVEFLKSALGCDELGRARRMGPPAPLVPFYDWDYYYIFDTVNWCSDTPPPRQVDVPKGFVTDLASVPPPFWSVLPKTASYTYPAIIHDWLYWQQNCERSEADEILRGVMIEMQVNPVKVEVIYEAVRAFGGAAWRSNRSARDRGERRILKRFPTQMSTTWEAWKALRDVWAD